MEPFSFKKVLVAAVIVLSQFSSVMAIDEDKSLKTFIAVTAVKNSKEAVITIRSIESTKSLVRLFNESGNIVYKQLVDVSGIYKKRFDFSNLSDGNYSLEVVVAGKVFKSSVIITDNQVHTVSEPLVEHQLFSIHGDTVSFRLDSAEPAVMQLYSTDGMLISSKTFSQNANLSGLEKGVYQVYLTYKGKTHIDYFNID